MINHYVGETCYYFPSDNTTFPNDQYTYSWLFDDGVIQTGYRAQHMWFTPGKHIITLTITDINTNLSSQVIINQVIGIGLLT